MPDQRAADRTAILAVIVLYKQKPSDSVTVTTLARALRAAHSVDCYVLIHDNSPDATNTLVNGLPEGFRYHPAPKNRGLYAAYEEARLAARAQGIPGPPGGYDWLLTLDQDTALPENFFSAIEPGLHAAAQDRRIAAIVPHLAEGEQLLSPAYVGMARADPCPLSLPACRSERRGLSIRRLCCVWRRWTRLADSIHASGSIISTTGCIISSISMAGGCMCLGRCICSTNSRC